VIDVNLIRDREIALHGLSRADDAYIIYYDETNNIRRLHVRPNGLNVSEPKSFVIAGIAHRAPVRDLKIQDLRSAARIQTSAKEIKLEHVGKGDFLSVLKAQKLEIFLRWILGQGFCIHYSVLDPLYWSIVDIVDSILTEYGNDNLLMANWQLKNALYTILREDPGGTVDLFQRYSYPDVGRARRPSFIAELRDLLDFRRHLLEHFDFMMLKGVLQIAQKLDSLPYLEDETPNVLIDGFGDFFIQRICLFKNSLHILDVEKVVEDYIEKHTFVDGDRELSIHRFATSHDEPGVQMSDVIAGLLGKFFSLIQGTSLEDLIEMRENLNAQQECNLALLKHLLDRSLEENRAFAHFILSLEDQRDILKKAAAFFAREAT
jgi:hypothetical protein